MTTQRKQQLARAIKKVKSEGVAVEVVHKTRKGQTFFVNSLLGNWKSPKTEISLMIDERHSLWVAVAYPNLEGTDSLVYTYDVKDAEEGFAVFARTNGSRDETSDAGWYAAW